MTPSRGCSKRWNLLTITFPLTKSYGWKAFSSVVGPSWDSVWVYLRFSSFPIDRHFWEIVQKSSGTITIHRGSFVFWFHMKQQLFYFRPWVSNALHFLMFVTWLCSGSVHFGTWARCVGRVSAQIKSKLYCLQCSSDEGQREERRRAPAEPLRAVCSRAACRE